MNKYKKDYSIEWTEYCEAESFEEAEAILDKQAEETYEESGCLDIYMTNNIECYEDDEE